MQQQEGGGQQCEAMALCACANGRGVKSKGIPTYQREEVCQSDLVIDSSSHTLLPLSMLWASIHDTKDIRTPFDHYMHLHESALFCLNCLWAVICNYFQLQLHLLLTLLFCHPHILGVIAFRQIMYLCELFTEAYLWCLYGLCCFKFLFLACYNGGHTALLAGKGSQFCNSLGAPDTNSGSGK